MKIIKLFVAILVIFCIIYISEADSGRLHLGIISAIKSQVDELDDRVKEKEEDEIISNLPDITAFLTQKTDQFIVDIDDICDGHPFKGENANEPHMGAHVHFDNSLNTWPKGSSNPENYPPIYAPTDGTIMRVDYTYPVVANDRYGIDLGFAKDSDDSIYVLCYSIEPMIPEPSEGFYRDFILVSEGDEVNKGDIIAYMYTPPNKDFAIHIHFHLMRIDDDVFMAPAIFSSDIVNEFYLKWNMFKNDNGDTMPACMGYKLKAHENPFGTGAVDKL